MKSQPKFKKANKKVKQQENTIKNCRQTIDRLKSDCKLRDMQIEEAETRAETFRRCLRDIDTECVMPVSEGTLIAKAEFIAEPIKASAYVPSRDLSEEEKQAMEEDLSRQIARTLVEDGLIHLEYPDPYKTHNYEAIQKLCRDGVRLVTARVDIVPFWKISRRMAFGKIQMPEGSPFHD